MIFEDIGYSKVDIGREHLKGFPEIVYGKHKTAQQIIGICQKLYEHDKPILVTGVIKEQAERVREVLPFLLYHESAQLLCHSSCQKLEKGKVVVLCAGTADYPVAEEARLTAEWMGCQVDAIYDIGVAGLGRLLSYVDEIRQASVVIAVAGMEGALPSVVSGLIETPLIAVPTSVGYGANLQGVTTLLAMLTSCSSGISVVNIDNGFGAAYQAALIIRLLNQEGM
ncbi:MAG: nickel pincer cofactor biosynthesis protein LarB [Aerococcaceae bacterium]|nr:nickel pincer cofactor biosynthesis protein LarB [Aerococcaceae bacterium]